MKEATGNLWSYPAEVVVITTNGFVKGNGDCVMGRGCAREARDRFPGIARKLGDHIKVYGNRPFNLGTWGNQRIASLPTKRIWSSDSDIELIITSCLQLVDMANKFRWDHIVMPRPGCGNGNLEWSDVRPRIAHILDDRFTVITH